MRCFLAALFVTSVLCDGANYDHVTAIGRLTTEDAQAGAKLYRQHCASCHGVDGKLALNPLARRFAVDPLKFGGDPYSLWKTISYGNGLMFRWDGVLSKKERYQIVHHLREDILKVSNKSQYDEPGETYFASLNVRAAEDAKIQAASEQAVEIAPGMIDGSGGTRMQYGPFLQHAIIYGPINDKNAPVLENTTEKALIVSLGNLNICYDLTRLAISGVWSGELADTHDTHHTSYKGSRPLRPGGEVHYQNVDGPGWIGDNPSFKGLHLHNQRVVLHYSIGSRTVMETLYHEAGSLTFARQLEIGPGAKSIAFSVSGGVPKLSSKVDGFDLDYRSAPDWLSVPASETTQQVTVWLSSESELPVDEALPLPDFEAITKGSPRRWPQTVQTEITRGVNVEGYALDEMIAPLANPYGSWMRLTALDFFDDGRIAVSTLSGDVWIVSPAKKDPLTLTWSRFAAGLYEPLGLRIVDEKIYVRGRDRITRLHDVNNNGEADYYESFYEDRNEIGGGYHAFKYDLQTDSAGYFYYSQSGYKSPLMGAVVRVAADGSHAQAIASDFRNPNGMGAGGPNNWVTVADNPSGQAVYNGFSLVKEGAIYGYEHERSTPMLVVLPARVDSSGGGQCWSDPKRWGPLSGSIIHTSYSRSRAFYCRTQDVGDYPNGFAMRLPFDFKAGAMRPRVSPIDGQTYIVCKKGWDSIARVDGVIYRIRATGDPSHLIQDVAATADGLQLTFPCALDATSLDPNSFSIIREPDKPAKGKETQMVRPISARLIDARTLHVGIPNLEQETVAHRTSQNAQGEPEVEINPAISITVHLKAGDGTLINQTIHATINSLPKR
ncbi:c-type cytochrome [Verrucomicrobiales bacterium]|nr:c-type cytochrome [Verrucomicrobiales bacterium]